jgi:GNAT superfamily N-acetyltransferase
MFAAVQPDAARRRHRLPGFFTSAARLGERYGELQLGPDAAAIWLPPGLELGPAQIIRSGLALSLLRFGPAAARRFIRITSGFEKAKEELAPGPCWHLFILGVEPSRQGRGRGSELIAPQLARVDAAKQRVYLETSEESNLSFYERHGFRCPGRRDPDGLPPFWPMIREPR